MVLGAGFVGSRVVKRVLSRGASLFTTLDTNQESSAFYPRDSTNVWAGWQVYASNRSQFMLSNRSSWHNLPPKPDAVLVTFPPVPLADIKEFYEAYLCGVPKVIVYGSTSRYKTNEPDEWVSEATEIDLSVPRVQGEEFIRESGGCCLVLSGIYGDERQPYQWLLKGLVRQSGNHYLNLIHVSDIVAVTEHFIANTELGRFENVNVSFGQPRKWKDILAFYKEIGKISESDGIRLPDEPASTQSRRVSNEKLRKMIPNIEFKDLFEC